MQFTRSRHPNSQANPLRRTVARLAALRPSRPPRNTLAEQPFDGLLLTRSALYRRSREHYLTTGGCFRALLVSSPRMLSSPTLLEGLIQYSPIETEMVWAATDPGERV